jgi:hypothetical protein
MRSLQCVTAVLCLLLVSCALAEDEWTVEPLPPPPSLASLGRVSDVLVTSSGVAIPVPDGLVAAVERTDRIFFTHGSGGLSIADAHSGALLWRSYDRFAALAEPNKQEKKLDLDADGEAEVIVLRGNELTVRSGASGAPLWSRTVPFLEQEQQMTEKKGRRRLLLSGAAGGGVCAWQMTESEQKTESQISGQCWSLASQTISTTQVFFSSLFVPQSVLANGILISGECELRVWSGSELQMFFGNRSEALRLAPASVRNRCGVDFEKRLAESAFAPPADSFRKRLAVSYSKISKILTGFDRANNRTAYRIARLERCAFEKTISKSQHSNLFSPKKKLILTSGVACVTRDETNDRCALLLVDAHSGIVWRNVAFQKCFFSLDVALRGNTAVVVWQTVFGNVISLVDFFEDDDDAAPRVRSRFFRQPFLENTLALTVTRSGLMSPLILISAKTDRVLALPLHLWEGEEESISLISPNVFGIGTLRIPGAGRAESAPGSRESQSAVTVRGVSNVFRIVLAPNGPYDTIPPTFSRMLLSGVLALLALSVLVTSRLRRTAALNRRWY